MKVLSASVLWVLWTLKFTMSRAVFNAVKWNKHTGNFEPIPGSFPYDFERNEIAMQSQRVESSNFNGQPLTISYVEDVGFFHFHDNNTRATGVYGDVYTILSQFLNFTLVLINAGNRPVEGASLSNGSYIGLLEDARLNQTDIIPKITAYPTRVRAATFTPAFWMNGLRIYTQENWKRDYTWMFNIYPMEIWLVIGLAVLTLSIVSLLIERVLVRNRGRQFQLRSYSDHLFAVSSMFFNQADGMDTIYTRCKILTFTMSFFSFLILTFYNAHLIRFMTMETVGAPFNDMKDLFEKTNLHVTVLHGSFADALFHSSHNYPFMKSFRQAKRFKVISDLEELLRHVCSNPDKYVLFDAEDAMKARKNKPCNLIPVGKSYYESPMASGISRGVQNARSINIGVLKLLEFGIKSAIEKRYLLPPKRETGHRLTDNLAIDMDGICVLIGIFGLGVIASIVTCIAENMLTTAKLRKIVRRLA